MNNYPPGVTGSEYEIARVSLKSVLQFYKEEIQTVEKSVAYHIEENRKEIERTAGRNEWIKQLRESIE